MKASDNRRGHVYKLDFIVGTDQSSSHMSPTDNLPLNVSNIRTDAARGKALGFSVLAAMLVIVSASASTVIGTYPNWDGSQTAGWAAAAQSFTVPAQDVLLRNFVFSLVGNGTSYEFSIVDLVAGQPTGPVLYSTVRPWSVGDQTISDINLFLGPSQQYAAVIDFQGYTSLSVAFDWPDSFDPYPGGAGYWLSPSQSEWTTFPNADLLFSAEFTQVPEPSTFSMIGFGCVALMISRCRKRRP
jgi:hypothetical protein